MACGQPADQNIRVPLGNASLGVLPRGTPPARDCYACPGITVECSRGEHSTGLVKLIQVANEGSQDGPLPPIGCVMNTDHNTDADPDADPV